MIDVRKTIALALSLLVVALALSVLLALSLSIQRFKKKLLSCSKAEENFNELTVEIRDVNKLIQENKVLERGIAEQKIKLQQMTNTIEDIKRMLKENIDQKN